MALARFYLVMMNFWEFAGKVVKTTRTIIFILFLVPIVICGMFVPVGICVFTSERKPKETFEGKFFKWPIYSSS